VTGFNAVLPDTKLAGVFDVFAVIRIVENLLSNAFKYGGSNSDVTLTVTENESAIAVDVHNYGPPIPQENWDTIFGFLKRYEAREHTREKSWGIGLAIAKAAAQGHKGSIKVASNEADGTSFTLMLPKNLRHHGQVIVVSL
jgi:signal transduction histidine kinase